MVLGSAPPGLTKDDVDVGGAGEGEGAPNHRRNSVRELAEDEAKVRSLLPSEWGEGPPDLGEELGREGEESRRRDCIVRGNFGPDSPGDEGRTGRRTLKTILLRNWARQWSGWAAYLQHHERLTRFVRVRVRHRAPVDSRG